MASPKTRPTEQDVAAFLDNVEDPRRREEARQLRDLMERVTGQRAVMWGPTMVGFGETPYKNSLGTHSWFDVGFSPRKRSLVIYGIHNGYGPENPLLSQLGPHTTGVSCVYIKRLESVDLDVLERLVHASWMARHDNGT